jgi:hypothetical protein
MKTGESPRKCRRKASWLGLLDSRRKREWKSFHNGERRVRIRRGKRKSISKDRGLPGTEPHVPSRCFRLNSRCPARAICGIGPRVTGSDVWALAKRPVQAIFIEKRFQMMLRYFSGTSFWGPAPVIRPDSCRCRIPALEGDGPLQEQTQQAAGGDPGKNASE